MSFSGGGWLSFIIVLHKGPSILMANLSYGCACWLIFNDLRVIIVGLFRD